MTDSLEIRPSAARDLASLMTLYGEAFPDEDLLPLVRELVQETPAALSLVASMGGSVAGHVVLTRCGVEGRDVKVALLGPLAVTAALRGRGIGAALVRAALDRQEDAGVTRVFVLGDPAYYERFGFMAEEGVAPPYPLPAAWRGAWQSLGLGGAAPPGRGRLAVPEPWRRRALWAP